MCFQTKIRENSKIFTNISEIVLIVLNYYNIITFFNSTDVTQTRKHANTKRKQAEIVFACFLEHANIIYVYTYILLFYLFYLF